MSSLFILASIVCATVVVSSGQQGLTYTAVLNCIQTNCSANCQSKVPTNVNQQAVFMCWNAFMTTLQTALVNSNCSTATQQCVRPENGGGENQGRGGDGGRRDSDRERGGDENRRGGEDGRRGGEQERRGERGEEGVTVVRLPNGADPRTMQALGLACSVFSSQQQIASCRVPEPANRGARKHNDVNVDSLVDIFHFNFSFVDNYNFNADSFVNVDNADSFVNVDNADSFVNVDNADSFVNVDNSDRIIVHDNDGGDRRIILNN